MSQDLSKPGYFETIDDNDFSETSLKPFGMSRKRNQIVSDDDDSFVHHEIEPGEPSYDDSISENTEV
jgi:hypothetical protein